MGGLSHNFNNSAFKKFNFLCVDVDSSKEKFYKFFKKEESLVPFGNKISNFYSSSLNKPYHIVSLFLKSNYGVKYNLNQIPFFSMYKEVGLNRVAIKKHKAREEFEDAVLLSFQSVCNLSPTFKRSFHNELYTSEATGYSALMYMALYCTKNEIKKYLTFFGFSDHALWRQFIAGSVGFFNDNTVPHVLSKSYYSNYPNKPNRIKEIMNELLSSLNSSEVFEHFINCYDKEGKSPIYYFIKSGATDIVKELLDISNVGFLDLKILNSKKCVEFSDVIKSQLKIEEKPLIIEILKENDLGAMLGLINIFKELNLNLEDFFPKRVIYNKNIDEYKFVKVEENEESISDKDLYKYLKSGNKNFATIELLNFLTKSWPIIKNEFLEHFENSNLLCPINKEPEADLLLKEMIDVLKSNESEKEIDNIKGEYYDSDIDDDNKIGKLKTSKEDVLSEIEVFLCRPLSVSDVEILLNFESAMKALDKFDQNEKIIKVYMDLLKPKDFSWQDLDLDLKEDELLKIHKVLKKIDFLYRNIIVKNKRLSNF